jgi:hypothetical protein
MTSPTKRRFIFKGNISPGTGSLTKYYHKEVGLAAVGVDEIGAS